MNSISKKRLALTALIFTFAVAALNAQQIPGSLLGQMLNQSVFDTVTENEFNRVFQNFLRTTYPGRNVFSQHEIADITSSFVLYLYSNPSVAEQWGKYAEAKREERERLAEQQRQEQEQIESELVAARDKIKKLEDETRKKNTKGIIQKTTRTGRPLSGGEFRTFKGLMWLYREIGTIRGNRSSRTYVDLSDDIEQLYKILQYARLTESQKRDFEKEFYR